VSFSGGQKEKKCPFRGWTQWVESNQQQQPTEETAEDTEYRYRHTDTVEKETDKLKDEE
jgi:hypothetical protein